VYHRRVQWYTRWVPTTRPRYQVTETPAVEHAIDVASRHWPGEPRSRLLLRVVDAGASVLEARLGQAVAERRKAIEDSSGKYPDEFGADYLRELREDWPR